MVSCKELRDLAKELKIRGYSKMNKQQLVDSVEGYAQSTKPAEPKADEPKPEPTEPVKVKMPKKGRPSTSPWVAFCREYSKEQGIPYKEAMLQKEKYLEWKSKRSENVEEKNVETD